MSDEQVKKVINELKPRIREAYDAAKIIASEGKVVNSSWLEDIGKVEVTWETCIIKFEARENNHSYKEWIDIALADGTPLLKVRYYISDYQTDFDISTFRNGAWVDRLITYSKEDVMAKKEQEKKAELEKKLKPYSDIDF